MKQTSKFLSTTESNSDASSRCHSLLLLSWINRNWVLRICDASFRALYWFKEIQKLRRRYFWAFRAWLVVRSFNEAVEQGRWRKLSASTTMPEPLSGTSPISNYYFKIFSTLVLQDAACAWDVKYLLLIDWGHSIYHKHLRTVIACGGKIYYLKKYYVVLHTILENCGN